MKVLFLVTGYPSDAKPSNGVFNNRAYALLTQCHEVQVIKLRSFVPWKSIVTKDRIGQHEYEVWNIVPSTILERLGIRWFWLEWFIIKMLARYFRPRLIDFDIIHSVGISGAAIVGCVLSERYSKAHICQAIGTDVNSQVPYYSSSKKDYLNRNVSAFGANSGMLAQQLQHYFPFKKICTIYRGVDLDKFIFTEVKEKTILFLGGIVSDDNLKIKNNVKGGEDVMLLWKQHEKAFTDRDIHLIFAGPNSRSTITKEWQSTLASPERVSILGVVSPENVKNLFKLCTIILIPSKAEGLPNVALEAMASGCVVVGTDVGGIPEVVVNGVTGFLFAPNDFLSKAPASIFNLFDSTDICNTMKRRAREYVSTKFRQNDFVEKYTELYLALKTK